MIPRPEVYETYWRFATLRQQVFFARLHGEPAPWTSDEIINTFKFCNVYRASDRVSQYLIRNVIYDRSYGVEDTLFRIVLFKIFNRIETWEYLERRTGDIRLATFNAESYDRLLDEALQHGQAIYTSAYMSCASKAYGYDHKHQNHLALLCQMFCRDHLAQAIPQAGSLQAIYELLLSYPLLGRFMAYQLATDLNYSSLIGFSENSFTVAGPGAKRGIQKCFESTSGKDDAYVIRWMVDHQEEEFRRFGLSFQDLWGRPLQCIDCQGLFCETDKYSRVAYPDLKSNRRRIKARFVPDPRPIAYFYPPKWGINDRVQVDPAGTLSPRLDPKHNRSLDDAPALPLF